MKSLKNSSEHSEELEERQYYWLSENVYGSSFGYSIFVQYSENVPHNLNIFWKSAIAHYLVMPTHVFRRLRIGERIMRSTDGLYDIEIWRSYEHGKWIIMDSLLLLLMEVVRTRFFLSFYRLRNRSFQYYLDVWNRLFIYLGARMYFGNRRWAWVW